ncbi:Nucleoside-diphosphate-sugar epimerase [Methylobacterium sp. 275MFSha3.1]|uniref:NAD-dependent epimerase/dehydratase family protein n=1 Tax=Methylobacterium sp. 275MFSha3.1 TaxID=1502746 RepID=UPI0008A755B4|nr:NAD(P)-dependent oxidoreductase [Methylobacterium sp. 275MFSha3.1]SEI12494.1 Nucleoside-diphosphate-sugar epimerase [Methylobacterium sp. 275MFSha3.1]
MTSSVRRVVLTGGTGFVGAHVVPALVARGFEVHALGRRPPSAQVTFHPVDLLDADAARSAVGAIGASHLLHLAWYAEPGRYWRSPANLDWLAASLALVRTFRETGGARAVVAGTCAEYAWGSEPLIEYGLCAPTTLYGAAKDATRRVLAAYASETGLSFAWGRLFFLYGPGEKPGRLVSSAIRALLAGERFSTSRGHQRRDFSHVADAASAFAALVDSAIEGPVNIGSGEAVPVSTILERIGRLTGRPELIDFGGRQIEQTEPVSIEADVTRLREEVGFYPYYDLESGLAHTLDKTLRA